MSRLATTPPVGLLSVPLAGSALLVLVQFQASSPPTPTTITKITATTTPIIKPTLLFGGACGLRAGTRGTVTTEAIVPAWIADDADPPWSGGGVTTTGGGAGVSTRTGAFVTTGGATVGIASTVITVGALTSELVCSEPLTATVALSEPGIALGPAAAVCKPALSSAASWLAVACLSPRSFAVARLIASLKPMGTSGTTSCKGVGFVV